MYHSFQKIMITLQKYIMWVDTAGVLKATYKWHQGM